MTAAPLVVLLDANVLFPFTLRDTLLRAAAAGYFDVRWSSRILDEMERNLVARNVMTGAQAGRLRMTMEHAFPDAAVEADAALEITMRNHPSDRHVAAAGVRAGASVIVTANLRDFRELPDGLIARSPDELLCRLVEDDPDGVVQLLRDQAGDLARPPLTFEQLLERLERLVPDFTSLARAQVRAPSPPQRKPDPKAGRPRRR